MFSSQSESKRTAACRHVHTVPQRFERLQVSAPELQVDQSSVCRLHQLIKGGRSGRLWEAGACRTDAVGQSGQAGTDGDMWDVSSCCLVDGDNA